MYCEKFRNEKFRNITTDILYEDGKVTVVSNKPYRLQINGKCRSVKAGENVFRVK